MYADLLMIIYLVLIYYNRCSCCRILAITIWFWPTKRNIYLLTHNISIQNPSKLFSISFRFVQAVHLIGNYYSLETVKLNTVVSTLSIIIIRNRKWKYEVSPKEHWPLAVSISSLKKVKMDILRTYLHGYHFIVMLVWDVLPKF